MAEYIERQKVFDSLPTVTTDKKISLYGAVADFMIIVSAIPAADVEPVVHCKDCRLRGREECAMFYRCDCGAQHTWETDNDFCSYGEKREDRHD